MRSARRRFLISGGLIGGALVVGGWKFFSKGDHLSPPPGFATRDDEWAITGWIRIAADNTVTVAVPRQEMGQGITTALPMLIAEELDADMAQMRFEQAPVDPVYTNLLILQEGVPFRADDQGLAATAARGAYRAVAEAVGLQATGGSSSMRDGWQTLRVAGAAARHMLLAAAARRFGVAVEECRAEAGRVVAGARSATFGELAAEAAGQPIPRHIEPKAPERFKLLGKSQARLDTPAKVDGSAQFGIDVRLPGMLYAAIAQCPAFGGRLGSVDAEKAKAMRGVKGVYALDATACTAASVAVVADRYWHAERALAQLAIVWLDGAHATVNSSDQLARYRHALDHGNARTCERSGAALSAIGSGAKVIEAIYEVPYLAHAALEPMNATAVVRGGACEIWVGSQAPSLVRTFAAKALGISPRDVTVHTPFLGGGFGRRAEMDVVMQVAELARRVPGTPIQLLWSRTQDIQHDVYRPMAIARLRAGVDAGGKPTGWHARIVSQSCSAEVMGRLWPLLGSDLMKDKTNAEGAADLPYEFPARLVEHVLAHEPVPVGFWRSVGHSFNAFFVESFVDEVAHAAGQSPLAFRRALLSAHPQHLKVLEAADRLASAEPLAPSTPGGRAGRGIALAESYHSIVAQVADVEVTADHRVLVRRVACAIDCGFAVNPDTVVAQMEGGIVFALSAALFGQITIKGGRVEQSGFSDYRMVSMAESPRIEVVIVQSGRGLGGVGEPGVPPLAPAVCNAIFAAAGKRVRKLPIDLAG